MVGQFVQSRYLLAAAASFQMLWLAAIGVSGSSANPSGPLLLAVYCIVLGIAVTWAPAGSTQGIQRFTRSLLRDERLLMAALALFVLSAGLFVSYSGEITADEEANYIASRIVAEQGIGEYFANYGGIYWLGDRHPPLMPLVYGLVMRVLGAHLIVMRLVSLLLSVGTVLLTYLVTKELYDRDTALRATLLLLSIPFLLRFGAFALLDGPMTFLFTLALLLGLRLLRAPSYRLSLVAGLVIGAGLLTRYTMVLIYPVMLGCSFLPGLLRRLKLHLALVVLVSLAVLATWLVYANSKDVFASQQQLISKYATVATTTAWGRGFLLETLLIKLPSYLGVYNVPLLFLGGLNLVRRRSFPDLLLLLWIAAVFLPLALTLPDPRYFMPAFPALAIAMARGLGPTSKVAGRTLALALLYCGGSLYLMLDTYQVAYIFRQQ